MVAVGAALAACAAIPAALGVSSLPARGATVSAPRHDSQGSKALKPGTWVPIGATFKTIIGVNPTIVTLPGDRAYILFKREPTASGLNYISAKGTLSIVK